MPTDTETLIIRLEATQRRFERQLANANRSANRRATAIERRFKRTNDVVSRSLGGIGTALTAAFSIRSAQRFLDTNTRIENSLRVTGLAGDDLAKVYDRLFESAQQNAAPLEALTQLYGRAAQVQNELGVSTEELLGFTNNVAVALRVAGTSASESSGALLQLGQALGAGVVRAEEFNSILEGALPVAQAAAAGLEEAGGSVSRLRQLVIDGRVSSEAFFRAFEAGSETLTGKVANAEITVSQGFIRLTNVLIRAAGEFDEGSEASARFGEILGAVANAIDDVDFSQIGAGLVDIIGKFQGGVRAANDFAVALGQATGLDNAGQFIADSDIGQALGIRSNRDVRDAESFDDLPITQNSGALELSVSTGGATPTTSTTTPRSTNTVSLSDFAITSQSSARSSRATRTSPQERATNSFNDDVAQIRERTAALEAETMLLATLNPLLEGQEFALDKLRATRELTTAAEEAGLTVEGDLKTSIDQLAEGYAQAEQAAAKLAEEQDDIVERAEQFRDFRSDTFRGFIQDVTSGTDAVDALSNALGRLADQFLNGDFGSPFSGGSGGGGGLLSSIGSIFGFADGGIAAQGKPLKKFAGGGVSNTAAIFGEAGPEAAVPLPDGRSIPVSFQGGPSMQAPTIIFNSETIINGGDDQNRISADLDRRDNALRAEVPQILQRAMTRGALR